MVCFDSDAFKKATEEFWYWYFWWSIQQSESHCLHIQLWQMMHVMKIGGVLMDFVQTTDVNMIFYDRSRRGAAAL